MKTLIAIYLFCSVVDMDRADVPKRKIIHKTIAEKYTAIKEVEGGKSKKDVAQKYGVPITRCLPGSVKNPLLRYSTKP